MDEEARRHEMVRSQIAARGVRDERVLDAMRRVPRECFVPESVRGSAYDDNALPIEAGQTISQPFIVALMVEALGLEPGERVLEVGAGSGYAAAVMGEIAGEVWAIERQPELAELAAGRLRELGYANVHVKQGDGTLGWPEHAPFDAITVAAGGPRVAKPLTEQLAIGGRLVMPVGESRRSQELVRVTRTGERTFERESLGAVRFVPLIGEAGWEDKDRDASSTNGPGGGWGVVSVEPDGRGR